MFKKIDIPCGVPEISWYQEHCKIPNFNTLRNCEFVLLKLDEIDNTNSNGQVVNDARDQGTDANNVNGLKSSFESKGLDVSKLPPIVGRQKNEKDKHPLYEGFSRYEGWQALEQQQIIVLMGDIAPGKNYEDVKDEVGLGCNDHHQSKKATPSDFKKRLIKYIDRTPNCTTKQCKKWFDSIPNSFTKVKIDSIIEDAFSALGAKETMASFSSQNKSAQKKANKLTNTKIDDLFTFNNKTGRSFEGMMIDVIGYWEKKNRSPEVYGYLVNTPAEKAHSERKKVAKKVKEFNETFRAIIKTANALQDDGEQFDLINLKGFLPQVLDVESEEIIKLDSL